jgi:hypothetical protein
MAVVSASFWPAAGTVHGPLPGPMRSPPPEPVSQYVHTYEDQRDHQNDDDHKDPSAAEVFWPLDQQRKTGQHYLAPAE